jgi:hypothetical protein
MQPISILLALFVGCLTLLTMTYALSINTNQVIRNLWYKTIDCYLYLFLVFFRRTNPQLLTRMLNVSMILVLVQSMMMIYKKSMMNSIVYDVSMISAQRNVFMILAPKRSVQMNNVNSQTYIQHLLFFPSLYLSYIRNILISQRVI